MKFRALVLLPACLLASCSSDKPLTAVQCQQILDAQDAMLTKSMPPGDYPALMALNKQAHEKTMAECVAGERYNQTDANCFVHATNLGGINACEANSKK